LVWSRPVASVAAPAGAAVPKITAIPSAASIRCSERYILSLPSVPGGTLCYPTRPAFNRAEQCSNRQMRRRRVLGVPAQEDRRGTPGRRATRPLCSASDRNHLTGSVIPGLRPAGCAQRGPEVHVRSMGALPHHRGSCSEHCGRLLDAELLLLEEHVRDAVLLGHLAQRERQQLLQITD